MKGLMKDRLFSMNAFSIARVLILLASLGRVLTAAEPTPDEIKQTLEYLKPGSSFQDKQKGYALAKKVDAREINQYLVLLLDSKEPGEKVVDVLLMPVSNEALILLVARFPECGITKRPVGFDDGDKEAFKKWWAANESRIEYHDGTHRLTAHGAGM
jgi:hypothetical protein